MNTNYSLKELIHDKENLELEIYKKLKEFQNKYECDVNIELLTTQEMGIGERITDVVIHIGM